DKRGDKGERKSCCSEEHTGALNRHLGIGKSEAQHETGPSLNGSPLGIERIGVPTHRHEEYLPLQGIEYRPVKGRAKLGRLAHAVNPAEVAGVPRCHAYRTIIIGRPAGVEHLIGILDNMELRFVPEILEDVVPVDAPGLKA